VGVPDRILLKPGPLAPEEIRYDSGTQLDAKVVGAFLTLMSQSEFQTAVLDSRSM
jgi:HD-GYP domain-containing protein (c-di-GMP phosphodiesterase class II)